MTKPDPALMALAVSVAAATEGSFKLDDAIYEMLFTGEGVAFVPFEHFTRSIDAAWTLLPDDDISLTKEGADDWVADLTMLDGDPQSFGLYVRGATPALALCAAALKARALAKETPNVR